MADRVIKGLECHLARLTDDLVNGMVHSCRECTYRGEMNCSIQLIANALELLKEQDAVEPIRSKDADVWYCGNCDEIVGEETLTMGGIQEVRHNYCPECGRKVKWDDKG